MLSELCCETCFCFLGQTTSVYALKWFEGGHFFLLQYVPCRAVPCLAKRRLAVFSPASKEGPCVALPSLAQPCRAEFGRAVKMCPCLVEPCQAVPRRGQRWRAVKKRPCRALPSDAWPSLAPPHHGDETKPSPGQPWRGNQNADTSNRPRPRMPRPSPMPM